MTESSNLYRLRKKRLLERSYTPSVTTDEMAYHLRPHRTLPELDEPEVDVWVPPAPSSSSVPAGCAWDQADVAWDDNFYFDCED